MSDNELHHPPDEPATPASTSRGSGSKHNYTGWITFLVVLVLVVIAIVAIAVHHKSSTTISKLAPAEVSITKTGFVPATITIKEDQAVVWTNDTASPHIVSSDPYPRDNALVGFNSKSALYQNQNYSYIFNKTGTFTYHDNLNPYTIKGTVIVKS